MRRIIDLTTNDFLRPHELRLSRRYRRALSIAICPLVKRKPASDSITLGITKDVSDTGICVLTTKKLNAESVMFAFLVGNGDSNDLAFFRANIQRESSKSGFFEYGLHVQEFMNDNYRRETIILSELIRTSFEFESFDNESSTELHPRYTN